MVEIEKKYLQTKQLHVGYHKWIYLMKGNKLTEFSDIYFF